MNFDTLYIFIGKVIPEQIDSKKITLSVEVLNPNTLALYDFAIENRKHIEFSHDKLKDLIRELILESVISKFLIKDLVKITKDYLGKEKYYLVLLEKLIGDKDESGIKQVFGKVKIDAEEFLANNLDTDDLYELLKDVIFNLVDIKNLRFISESIKFAMENVFYSEDEDDDEFCHTIKFVFGLGLNGNIYLPMNEIKKLNFDGIHTTKETYATALITTVKEVKDEKRINKIFQYIFRKRKNRKVGGSKILKTALDFVEDEEIREKIIKGRERVRKKSLL